MKYKRDGFFSELLYRFRHPSLLFEAFNIFFNKARAKMGLVPAGIDVIERDWDNLIILDACRYDYFKEEMSSRQNFDSSLSSVTSKATQTGKFLQENIHDRELHDTVYVTTSPHLYHSQNGDRRFDIKPDLHEEVHVWQEGYYPSQTTKAAIKASEEYPHKRLIVHYLPPHTPFIDSEIFSGGIGYEDLNIGTADVSDEDLRSAYRDNLTIGMDHVERLVASLSGKTVITSDHGQLLGEKETPLPVKGYGHPELYQPELLKVPWLELSFEARREIVSDPPIRRDLDAKAAAKESLKDLGYL